MLTQLLGTVTNTHTDHGNYKKHAYTRNIANTGLKASNKTDKRSNMLQRDWAAGCEWTKPDCLEHTTSPDLSAHMRDTVLIGWTSPKWVGAWIMAPRSKEHTLHGSAAHPAITKQHPPPRNPERSGEQWTKTTPSRREWHQGTTATQFGPTTSRKPKLRVKVVRIIFDQNSFLVQGYGKIFEQSEHNQRLELG